MWHIKDNKNRIYYEKFFSFDYMLPCAFDTKERAILYIKKLKIKNAKPTKSAVFSQEIPCDGKQWMMV